MGEHNLYRYGHRPQEPLSDINGAAATGSVLGGSASIGEPSR
jgi:hypothetical protein